MNSRDLLNPFFPGYWKAALLGGIAGLALRALTGGVAARCPAPRIETPAKPVIARTPPTKPYLVSKPWDTQTSLGIRGSSIAPDGTNTAERVRVRTWGVWRAEDTDVGAARSSRTAATH